jgi:undecaprenyl-diphosphatase
MIAGGFFAGIGELNIYYTLLIAFLGMLLGDNISFFLGRLKFIKMNRIRSVLKGKINLDKIINNSNGNLFIIFYHFPVYARMVVPTILGNLNYSLKKWMLLNTIGTLIFTTTFILIGYFVGLQSRSIENAISISSHIQLGFLIIFSIFIVLGVLSFLKIFKLK